METTKREMIKILHCYRLCINLETAVTFIKEDKDMLSMWKESTSLDDFQNRVYQSDKRYCGAAMYMFKCDPENLDYFGDKFAYIKNVEVKTWGDKYLYIGNDNCKTSFHCGDRAKVSVFHDQYVRKLSNMFEFICYIEGKDIKIYTDNWNFKSGFVSIGDGGFAIYRNYNRFAIYKQYDILH